jgi:cell wall-associated NlpC family hydrolase
METNKMSIAIIICTRINFITCLGLSAIAILLLTTSCATTQKQPIPTILTSEHHQSDKNPFNDHEIEQRLREEYSRWKGTRHRLGGNDRNGVDCSGFVKAVYANLFNIDLPRTTQIQAKQGQPISSKELKAGDLVFFRPPSYPRHVGIFLSKTEFVHASKNKGVTISKIDAHYWGKYYWTARRILP